MHILELARTIHEDRLREIEGRMHERSLGEVDGGSGDPPAHPSRTPSRTLHLPHRRMGLARLIRSRRSSNG